MDTIFDNINEYLISRDYVKKEDVNGCSEEEIQFLEEKINGHFPQSFRTFLKALGKLNTDIFYSDDYKIGFNSFEEVHNDFRERLRRFELEVFRDLVILFTHYNDTAYFFKLPIESDDPPLFFIREDGDLELGDCEMSLTQFFRNELSSETG